MAAGRLVLEVVTPERTALEAEAESIILPAIDGYLGIEPGHAPMVAGLTPGVLAYGPVGAEKEQLAVSGGFMEVSGDRVTVLADTAEQADEIDVERAQAAKERAQTRLRRWDAQANVDFTRAQAALDRATSRLRATGSR